jgi:hypothetical protein
LSYFVERRRQDVPLEEALASLCSPQLADASSIGS